MRIIDLVQGTPAWRTWRSEGIGASDAAAVLGLSPFRTRRQLFEEITGLVPRPEPSYAMRRGSRLEAPARLAYTAKTGVDMTPICAESSDFSWLRASLDGISADYQTVLEIKWPNWRAHEQALEGYVPDYYWPQIQQQMLVSGAMCCDYWSGTKHTRFGEDQKYALVRVAADPDYQELMLEHLATFWEEVCLANT